MGHRCGSNRDDIGGRGGADGLFVLHIFGGCTWHHFALLGVLTGWFFVFVFLSFQHTEYELA